MKWVKCELVKKEMLNTLTRATRKWGVKGAPVRSRPWGTGGALRYHWSVMATTHSSPVRDLTNDSGSKKSTASPLSSMSCFSLALAMLTFQGGARAGAGSV